jgi:hypothetical protein
LQSLAIVELFRRAWWNARGENQCEDGEVTNGNR